MYARVSTLEGSPGQIDEGLRYLREEILPTGKDDPGFKGLIALGDRNSGKALSITLWESEEDMRATEQGANELRRAWSETSGQEIISVESYEVGLFEVESQEGLEPSQGLWGRSSVLRPFFLPLFTGVSDGSSASVPSSISRAIS